jgi:hypothetical protein
MVLGYRPDWGCGKPDSADTRLDTIDKGIRLPGPGPG